jgi:ABC-type glycerol-3-phosphate transport system substrate-binding protein
MNAHESSSFTLNITAAAALAFTAAAHAGTLTVLLKMIPGQERFFRENIAEGFEQKTGHAVAVKTFESNWDLVERTAGGLEGADVIKVPMSLAQVLADKGAVVPLESVCGADSLKALGREYFLMNLGTIDGTVYYVPRKFETRIMVYRRSRVAEAVQGWGSFREKINGALQNSFHADLPPDYALEPDPSSWNCLDLFAAGFFWAETPYGGAKAGRIAHRGKQYSGTAVGLMDRCFQQGASNEHISDTSSRFFHEVLQWESLFAANGIYPKRMWEQGWDGTDIWKAFGNDEIFLSFLTQLDCYFLHGAGTADMPGYMGERKDDLGYASMPRGLSSDLRTKGTGAVSTGGWLWGVGAGSKNPRLALEFIRFITNSDNQYSETNAFGIIPVRKDILGKANMMFGEQWKTEVFQTSLTQLKANGKNCLPSVAGFKKIEQQYVGKWKETVANAAAGNSGGTATKYIVK